jgi:hypothetical protein
MLYRPGSHIIPIIAVTALILFCSLKAPVKQPFQKANENIAQASSEDFNLFFKKFNADAAFQLSRVRFPFKMLEMPDQEEKQAPPRFTQKKDWKYFRMLTEGETVTKRKHINKTTVRIQLMVKETGVLVFYYFKCINGKWWLDHSEDASD